MTRSKGISIYCEINSGRQRVRRASYRPDPDRNLGTVRRTRSATHFPATAALAAWPPASSSASSR
jgi:hypothetical protein